MKNLHHALHAVFHQRPEEGVVAVQCPRFLNAPLAVQPLQSGSQAKESRYVLLELGPRPHKWNGSKVTEGQWTVLGPARWATADVGFAVVLERSPLCEVIHELRVLL